MAAGKRSYMGPKKPAAPAPAPTKPAGPVKRDAQEQPIPPPLEDVNIHVDASPRKGRDPDVNESNLDHAKKIDRSLKREIQQAIDGAKEGGHVKQLDAAQRTVERTVKENIDPATIKEVKVKVSGEAGGESVERKITIPVEKPAEPGGTPPTPASKS